MSKTTLVSELARTVLREEIANGSMRVLALVTVFALALSEVYAHGVRPADSCLSVSWIGSLNYRSCGYQASSAGVIHDANP